MERKSPPVVRIVYLARLREALQRSVEEIALPPEVRTAGELREWLAARGDAWAREFAPQRAVRVAVNHSMVGGEAALGSGDEVAFFPPVTGG